jgi:hypothetical protein
MDQKMLLGAAFVVIVIAAAAVSVTQQGTTPPQGTPAGTTGVYRTFSSNQVSPGGEITVTIDVVVAGDEDYYAIEEYVPEGWQVKMGDTLSDERRLTFYTIENAESKAYYYIAVAPQDAGEYTFGGIYMFEGMDDEAVTAGDVTITVI